MDRIMREKPSPAMVVALIALFVALTGVASGALQVPNNSITSKKLKDGKAVKNQDIVPGTITAASIANDTLTGAQIDESQLGTVPKATQATNAANAGNADTLDSLDSTDFLRGNAAAGGDLAGTYPNPTIAPGKVTTADFASNAKAPFAGIVDFAAEADVAGFESNGNSLAGTTECCIDTQQFFEKTQFDTGTTPIATVLDLDGVTLKFGCHNFGSGLDPVATVDTGPTSTIQGAETDGAGSSSGISGQGVAAQTLTGNPRDPRGSGQFTVANGNDRVVSVQYAFDDASTFGSEPVCTLYGTAWATSTT